jgi:hypothetical protein
MTSSRYRNDPHAAHEGRGAGRAGQRNLVPPCVVVLVRPAVVVMNRWIEALLTSA